MKKPDLSPKYSEKNPGRRATDLVNQGHVSRSLIQDHKQLDANRNATWRFFSMSGLNSPKSHAS